MQRSLELTPNTRPLFSRWTIVPVFALAVVVAMGIAIWGVIDPSELLYEIDPTLKACAIGVGVFVGILADAVYASAAAQGIGVRRMPAGVRMAATFVIVPLFCVFGMTLLARRIVEYRAFHGLPVVTAPLDFTIVGTTSGKSGYGLRLRAAPGERVVTLPVGRDIYYAAHVGEHVALPVQTGRGGVQRMIPPVGSMTPGDLHP